MASIQSLIPSSSSGLSFTPGDFSKFPAGIAKLLGDFFPTGLKLSSYSGGKVAGSKYSVKAPLNGTFKGLTNPMLEFEFDISATPNQLTLTIPLPANWKISDSFEDLKDTVANQLTYINPAFVLNSTPPASIFTPSFFKERWTEDQLVDAAPGTIQNTMEFSTSVEIKDKLAWLLNGGTSSTPGIDTTFPLESGLIGEHAGKPVLYAKLDTGAHKPLDVFGTKFSFGAEIFALPVNKKIITGKNPELVVYGKMTTNASYILKGSKENFTLNGLFTNLDMMPLDLEVNKVADIDLKDLASLFGNNSGMPTSGIFPANIPSVNLQLTKLECSLLVSSLSIYSLSATIEFDKKAPPPKTFNPASKIPIDFNSLKFKFSYFPGSEEILIDADTTATIFGAEFEANLEFPFLQFSAGLKDPLRLDTILKQVDTTITIPGLTKLDISSLLATGNVTDEIYSFSATLDTDWTIGGFTLSEFSFSISHGPIGNSCSFDAKIEIAGNPYDISASYDNGAYSGEVKGLKLGLSSVLGHFKVFKADPSTFNSILPNWKNYYVESIDFTHTDPSSYSFGVNVHLASGEQATIFFEMVKSVPDISISMGGVRAKVSKTSLFFAYVPPNGPEKIEINNLITKHLSLSPTELSFFPKIELTIAGGVFSYEKTKKQLLVYLELDEKISLTELPVIGTHLATEDQAKIALTGLAYNKNADLSTLQTELASFQKAPDSDQKTVQALSNFEIPSTLEQGLQLTTTATLGSWTSTLNIGQSLSGSSQDASTDTSSPMGQPISASNNSPNSQPATPIGGGLKWINVNKTIQPVQLQSIGFKLANGDLEIGINALLQIGPVDFEVIDLNITSPLSKFAPSFGIKGLGLEFDKGDVSIAGLLEYKDLNPGYEFDGGLICNLPDISISAFASFSTGKKPSLFAYGFLGAPLFDIVIVEVNGIGAGFGINRELIPPPPAQIANFPLVAAAEGPQPVAKSTNPAGDNGELLTRLTKMVGDMDKYIPIKQNEYFFMAGVRGSVFELIELFVLAALEVGSRLKFDLFGVLSMAVPTDEPIAELQIAFDASFQPAQGILMAAGALTPNSYIFSPNAKLTGSFGYFAAFKDQIDGTYKGAKSGDMVMVAGSYGPYITKQSYFPKVAPLTLSWRVSNDFHVKATAYFALVPNALAVGGALMATFKTGGHHFSAGASFNIQADFFIHWKPLHYNADMSLEFKAYGRVHLIIHKTFHLNISAKLTIWGPSFSGHASLRIHILFTFHIHVNWGEKATIHRPLDWNTFKKNFLPDSSKIVSVRSSSGVETQISDSNKIEYEVVNPKEFAMVISSVIPCTSAVLNGTSLPKCTAPADMGVWPMQMEHSDFDAPFTISIQYYSDLTSKWQNAGPNTKDDWTPMPIFKSVPSALWANGNNGDVSVKNPPSDTLIDEVCTGFKITAPNPSPSHSIGPFDRSSLNYDTTTGKPVVFVKPDTRAFKAYKDIDTAISEIEQKLKPTLSILTEMGFTGTDPGPVTFNSIPLERQ